MTPVLSLDTGNEKQMKSVRRLLRNIASGQVAACIKQAVKIRNSDKYEFRDVQTALTDTGMGALVLLDEDEGLAYIIIKNLKKHNVKQIQQMWYTVKQRGSARLLEHNEANDYIMTLDCFYNSESEQKSYIFGCDWTPKFCSSDGDDDLTLAVRLDRCFVSVDPYTLDEQREAEYYAAKAKEEGREVMALTETDYDKEPEETAKPVHDALNLDFISGVVQDGEEGEDK